MATTIHKQTVLLSELNDVTYLKLPAFCEILTVAKQSDEHSVSIWYRCSPDAGKVSHAIHVCGTGHPCPPKHEAPYISTVVFGGGSLVLHFFDGGSV